MEKDKHAGTECKRVRDGGWLPRGKGCPLGKGSRQAEVMTSSCRALNPAEQLRPPEVRQPRMPEAQHDFGHLLKGGTLGPTINHVPSTEPLQPRQSLTLLSKVGSSTHTDEAGL